MKVNNDIQKPEEDLLNDEFFIRSVLEPSPDTDDLWDSLAQDGMLDGEKLEHSREFMEIVKYPGRVMTNKEINDIWTNIEIQNKENLHKRIRRRNYYLWGAVATILLMIGSMFFIRFAGTDEVQDILAVAGEMEIIEPNDNNIRLIISGEKAVELQEKSADITLDGEGKILVNSEVVEQKPTTGKTGKAEINYNQLIIPKGTRSRLTLSDGTTMNVNSGSRVVFPDVFTGKKREIFVEGEVFLDVTPNTEMPFVVRTNKINVEVLGTSFNVSAYNDESRQTVVLVTGSVSVITSNNRKAELKPSQMLTYTDEDCFISRVDVTPYISWKDGLLVTEYESVSSIMRKLSRFYGKSITCDTSLEIYYGGGKLDLIGDFDEIMNDLTGIFPIEVFRNGEEYFVKRKTSE